MATIRESEPTRLIVSDTWRWNKHLSDHRPSEGWTLKYQLQGPGVLAEPITASASASGDYFEVRHAPADHADLPQGSYTLIGYVEKDGDRFTVYPDPDETTETGSLFLQAFATSAPQQTHDEKVLAQIDTAIETLSANTKATVQVNGRTVEYRNLPELVELQGVYRSRVIMARNGGQLPRRRVVFRRA